MGSHFFWEGEVFAFYSDSKELRFNNNYFIFGMVIDVS